MEERRRHRLMSGTWGRDLEERLRSQFGLLRRNAIGPKSKAKNSFGRITTELATLYGDAPAVRHSTAGELGGLLGPDGPITNAGLWPLMQRFQKFVIGAREYVMAVDWAPSTQSLVYRMVRPDLVVAQSSADNPGVPTGIEELRWRADHRRWAWDVWDVSDQDNPSLRILVKDSRGNVQEDLTESVLGRTFSGPDYVWRYNEGARDGVPFIPRVLYHAAPGSQLFDPFDWFELAEGALDIACLYTFWQHAVFRASWPARYALGAHVVGVEMQQSEGGARQVVPNDPTALLNFQADPSFHGQAIIGQWAPAADVLTLQQAISAYERTVTDVAGIDGANVVRDSSDAWSGAALSINRDGKREAQRFYAPLFRPRDLELMEKSAAILNGQTGTSWPESGYRIAYRSIPLSPQELKGRREHNTEMISAGRMSIVEAYVDEHPGSTEDEARTALRVIRETNDEFMSAPEPAAPARPDDDTQNEEEAA